MAAITSSALSATTSSVGNVSKLVMKKDVIVITNQRDIQIDLIK